MDLGLSQLCPVMTLQDWAWGYSRALSNQQALEELLDFHDNDIYTL